MFGISSPTWVTFILVLVYLTIRSANIMTPPFLAKPGRKKKKKERQHVFKLTCDVHSLR